MAASKPFDNTNRGVLFINNRKESANHPDRNGSINVDGVEYWLDGWIKTPKAGGAQFLSLSIKPKVPKAKPAAPVGGGGGSGGYPDNYAEHTKDDFSDPEIPFVSSTGVW